jgi:hypothetical protein
LGVADPGLNREAGGPTLRPITPKQQAAGSVPVPRRASLPDAPSLMGDGSGDPLRTASELAETLVPQWADHAVVDLLDGVCIGETQPDTRWPVLHRVAVAHAPVRARPDSFLTAGTIVRLSSHSRVLSTMARGETEHVPRVDSFTADHLATELGTPRCAEFLRDCAVLFVPLMAGEKTVGHVVLVRDPGRPGFGEDTIKALVAFARWAAQCMDAGHFRDRQTRLVDELRQGLRPDLAPQPANVEVHWRYLPDSRAARIGGDWFDVIPLGDGRIALVIGDVMGHGVQAAIVMSRCKTIVRTLVLLGLSPDQVLERFDRNFAELACLEGDDHVATCLIVVYDPAAQRCQAANAGQIPPVLVHPDGHSEILDIPTGAPIGADGPGFRLHTFPARHGSLLALCTDGFAVLHHADIDRALIRLSAALTDPGRSLDEICESAFHGIDTELRNDDVTLLLARLLGGQPSGGAARP